MWSYGITNFCYHCLTIITIFTVSGIGDAIEDIDECRTGTPCGDLMCVNTIGSYECICPNGFTHDDGLSCRDIDECTETNNCGFYGCSNFPGGYICECPVNSLWNPFRIVFCSTLVMLQLMQCYPDQKVILQLQCNLWSDEKTCKSILWNWNRRCMQLKWKPMYQRKMHSHR